MPLELEKKVIQLELYSLRDRLTRKIKEAETQSEHKNLNPHLKERLLERVSELKERLLEVEYMIKLFESKEERKNNKQL